MVLVVQFLFNASAYEGVLERSLFHVDTQNQMCGMHVLLLRRCLQAYAVQRTPSFLAAVLAGLRLTCTSMNGALAFQAE
jgi:hypothetical protein